MKKENYTCISNSSIEKIIDEWVRGERDRRIMKDRYIDLMCYEPLAEKYGISVSTIKRIITKNDKIFFQKINELITQKEKSVDYSSVLPYELVNV